MAEVRAGNLSYLLGCGTTTLFSSIATRREYRDEWECSKERRGAESRSGMRSGQHRHEKLESSSEA